MHTVFIGDQDTLNKLQITSLIQKIDYIPFTYKRTINNLLYKLKHFTKLCTTAWKQWFGLCTHGTSEILASASGPHGSGQVVEKIIGYVLFRWSGLQITVCIILRVIQTIMTLALSCQIWLASVGLSIINFSSQSHPDTLFSSWAGSFSFSMSIKVVVGRKFVSKFFVTSQSVTSA